MARAARGKAPWPDVLDRRMEGIFFLAVDRIEGGSYYRTIRGRYVHRDHLKPVAAVTMRGQLLSKDHGLPLAFVYSEDSPVYRLEHDRLRQTLAPSSQQPAALGEGAVEQ